MKNANLPASPIGNLNINMVDPYCCGLTKREHFAAMAMQGLLANSEWVQGMLNNTGDDDDIASAIKSLSYSVADTMLDGK